jgi:elongation factor 1 alpha-like protein
MSRHRMLHTLDVDEELDLGDDYEDGGEGDAELSPEDRQAMREGTEAVMAALGVEAGKVTPQQIQEALWHYYYDVDKSVTYLTKTYIAPAPKPQPKQTKEGSRDFRFVLQHHIPCLQTHPGDYQSRPCSTFQHSPPSKITPRAPGTSGYPVASNGPIPCSWYFHGIPRGSVPKEREAVLVPPKALPGGLLGGGEDGSSAPKVSKLQALAAARKKKTGEKKAGEGVGRTTSKLADLAIADKMKENVKPRTSGISKLQKRLGETGQVNPAQEIVPEAVRAPTELSCAMEIDETHIGQDQSPNKDTPMDTQFEEEAVPLVHFQPSAFAQTLFSSDADTPKRPAIQHFTIPYMAHASSFAKAFSEPSPDDVVLQAQAQGSRIARKK